MDVVSPELNSLLPDEIMDTEAIEDMAHSQSDAAAAHSQTVVPMEMDLPIPTENLSICSNARLMEQTQTLTISAATDSTLSVSSGNQPSSLVSTSSPLVTIKPAMATSTATTKTTDSVTGTTVSTSGLQKLTTQFAISAANHQIILNKVATSQATEAAKSAGTSPQVIKHDGQKLLVTAIGKSGQPIVLQLPHTGSKPGVPQTSGDTKLQTSQFKVVTIGGRSELKPMLVNPGNQMTTLQTQQLKTLQVMLTFWCLQSNKTNNWSGFLGCLENKIIILYDFPGLNKYEFIFQFLFPVPFSISPNIVQAHLDPWPPQRHCQPFLESHCLKCHVLACY